MNSTTPPPTDALAQAIVQGLDALKGFTQIANDQGFILFNRRRWLLEATATQNVEHQH